MSKTETIEANDSAGQCNQWVTPGAPEGRAFDPRDYPPPMRCTETRTRLLKFSSGGDSEYGDGVYHSVQCCPHRGTHKPW